MRISVVYSTRGKMSEIDSCPVAVHDHMSTQHYTVLICTVITSKDCTHLGRRTTVYLVASGALPIGVQSSPIS